MFAHKIERRLHVYHTPRKWLQMGLQLANPVSGPACTVGPGTDEGRVVEKYFYVRRVTSPATLCVTNAEYFGDLHCPACWCISTAVDLNLNIWMRTWHALTVGVPLRLCNIAWPGRALIKASVVPAAGADCVIACSVKVASIALDQLRSGSNSAAVC